MPTARYISGAGAVDGRIYIVGGDHHQGGKTATNESYDPTTDAWATYAVMPTARQGIADTVIDGKVYAIGESTIVAIIPTVEVSDLATDRWIEKGHSYFVLDSRPYSQYAIPNPQYGQRFGDFKSWQRLRRKGI